MYCFCINSYIQDVHPMVKLDVRELVGGEPQLTDPSGIVVLNAEGELLQLWEACSNWDGRDITVMNHQGVYIRDFGGIKPNGFDYNCATFWMCSPWVRWRCYWLDEGARDHGVGRRRLMGPVYIIVARLFFHNTGFPSSWSSVINEYLSAWCLLLSI